MDKLTNEMFEELSKEFDLEVALIKSVQLVESGGRDGFLSNGEPQILFEGHQFYKQLATRVSTGTLYKYTKVYPDIVYKNYDKSKYKGGILEHQRLQKAVRINREAALLSASWGMFQIMGFNYKLCGCSTLQEFINIMYNSHQGQIKLFLNFLKNTRSGGSTLLTLLKNHQWALFAKGYNGPSYATNQYDKKLENAYKTFKK